MVQIICAAIAAAASVVAAFAGIRVRRADERMRRREERRAKESRLAMDLMYASCALSLTTAKKLAGMHTNGDVEEAMTAAEQAQGAYISFARDEAAKNFAKM